MQLLLPDHHERVWQVETEEDDSREIEQRVQRSLEADLEQDRLHPTDTFQTRKELHNLDQNIICDNIGQCTSVEYLLYV